MLHYSMTQYLVLSTAQIKLLSAMFLRMKKMGVELYYMAAERNAEQ